MSFVMGLTEFSHMLDSHSWER